MSIRKRILSVLIIFIFVTASVISIPASASTVTLFYTLNQSFEASKLPASVSTGDTREKLYPYVDEGGVTHYLDNLKANSIGDYIEYSVNIKNPGAFIISINMGSSLSGGIYQAYLDGQLISPKFDTYGETVKYLDQSIYTTLGVAQVATAGTKKLRFVAKGKNPSSTGYSLPIFSIDFTYNKGRFYDGFDSGSFTTGGWTNSGTCMSGANFKGGHSAKLETGDVLTSKTIPTTNCEAFLCFNYKTVGFTSEDKLIVDVWNGECWQPQMIYYGSTSNWGTAWIQLIKHNPESKIRFRTGGNINSGKMAYIDEVYVLNTQDLEFIADESFESGSFSTNKWINNGAAISSSKALYGTKSALLNGKDSLVWERTVDPAKRGFVSVNFRYKTTGCEDTDHLYVEFWDGQAWQELLNFNGNTKFGYSYENEPLIYTYWGGDGNYIYYLYYNAGTSKIKLRFRTAYNDSSDCAYIDYVQTSSTAY